jgi:hypothetical protein
MAVTAANVRPLEGSVIKQFYAGGAIDVGDTGYIASDGDVEVTDANAAATVKGIGVCVAVGDTAGATAAAAGDAVSMVTFGPVGGFSSLTPGATQFISETAGAITETEPSGAGTWSHIIGYAMSATVLFVQPGTSAPTSNS